MDEADFNAQTELRGSHDEKHMIIDQLESGRASHRDQQQIYCTHDTPMQAKYSQEIPLQGNEPGRQGLSSVSLKQPPIRPQSASTNPTSAPHQKKFLENEIFLLEREISDCNLRYKQLMKKRERSKNGEDYNMASPERQDYGI